MCSICIIAVYCSFKFSSRSGRAGLWQVFRLGALPLGRKSYHFLPPEVTTHTDRIIWALVSTEVKLPPLSLSVIPRGCALRAWTLLCEPAQKALKPKRPCRTSCGSNYLLHEIKFYKYVVCMLLQTIDCTRSTFIIVLQ